MHRNKKFWPKCDKNNNVASGPIWAQPHFLHTMFIGLRENHSTDWRELQRLLQRSMLWCCYWLAAKNWVSRPVFAVFGVIIAPRSNSTQLPVELSWVELSRIGRYDHGFTRVPANDCIHWNKTHSVTFSSTCKRTAIEIFQTHVLPKIPLLHFPPPALPCRFFHSRIFIAPILLQAVTEAHPHMSVNNLPRLYER